MNTKYIIGAIVAIIVVLIGGALLMGGGTTLELLCRAIDSKYPA